MKKFTSSFWGQSLLYTLLHRFSIIFFGVITYFVLVRKISPEENGLWSLFLTIVTLIEVIKQGLLRNPLIKFLNMPEYSKDEVQSTGIFINLLFSLLVIAVIATGGTLIAAYLKSPHLYELLLWNTIFILLLIPFNHCEVILQANFKYQQIFIAYFLRQGLFMIGVMLLAFVFPNYLSLVNLVLLQAFSLFTGTVLIFIFSRSLLPKKLKLNRTLSRRILHFGKYVFGTNLFSNLARFADHFVTANAIPDPELGKRYVSYYNATGRINNLIDMPSVAVADVLFPKNVQTLETEGIDKVKYYFERMVGIIISIVLPVSIVIMLLPKLTLIVIAGKQYLEAANILRIVMLIAIIRPFFYQFGGTMDAIGKPQLNFWYNMVFMALSFGFTYLGLFLFGRDGAAYALVAHQIVCLIIVYPVLKKHVNISMRNIVGYTIQSYKDMFSVARRMLKRQSQLS
ncbi:MAG TPA: oligosaccharide flippase family protein [Chitinophagaceae bacterium]|nr:oligosaccharide flippase family protein [Chitinophagaceae bacterium]